MRVVVNYSFRGCTHTEIIQVERIRSLFLVGYKYNLDISTQLKSAFNRCLCSFRTVFS